MGCCSGIKQMQLWYFHWNSLHCNLALAWRTMLVLAVCLAKSAISLHHLVHSTLLSQSTPCFLQVLKGWAEAPAVLTRSQTLVLMCTFQLDCPLAAVELLNLAFLPAQSDDDPQHSQPREQLSQEIRACCSADRTRNVRWEGVWWLLGVGFFVFFWGRKSWSVLRGIHHPTSFHCETAEISSQFPGGIIQWGSFQQGGT